MRNNNLLSIVKDTLNLFKNKVKGVSPDILVFEGIALFILVFINGSLPSYLPQAASNDPKLTPDVQFQLTRQAELNKNIFNGFIGLNFLLVAAYISTIKLKLQDIEKRRIEILPLPENELEYLSLLRDALKQFPNKFSKAIGEMRLALGDDVFEEMIEKYIYEYFVRQDALIGLKRGFLNKENDEGLNSTVRASCDFALGEDCDFNSKDTLYRCMYAYITAWLVCSINNNQFLPIDSIFYQDPNRKNLYIKAINDLIDRFHYEPANSFFTVESIKVVLHYLNELVVIIDKQPTDSSQASKSNDSISSTIN